MSESLSATLLAWEMRFDCSESLHSHGNIILLKWKSCILTETNCFGNPLVHFPTTEHSDLSRMLMPTKPAAPSPRQTCSCPRSPGAAEQPSPSHSYRGSNSASKRSKPEPDLQLARAPSGEKEAPLPFWGLPVREIYLPHDMSQSVCHLRSIHGFIKHHSLSLSKAIKSGRWMALRLQPARQRCSSVLEMPWLPFSLFPA